MSARAFGSETEAVQTLARPETRRHLSAMAGRRLPRAEVADLVQTVLCDALAAERVPADPEELARWVSGIARHKIADVRRREARVMALESVDEPEDVDASSRVEARELLAAVFEAAPSERDRETLDWMVREHEGETLCAIAAEQGLPPPTVRKRISRLRRILRSRFAWAGAAALLVLAVVAPELARTDAPPSFVAAGELGELAGVWRVAEVVVPAELPAPARAVTSWLAEGARVELRGDRVVASAAGRSLERRVRVVEWDTNGMRVRLVDEEGRALDALVARHGDSLVITALGGTRGSLRLER